MGDKKSVEVNGGQMYKCNPIGENKRVLIPPEGTKEKNIFFSPNKRKSERSERVSLW